MSKNPSSPDSGKHVTSAANKRDPAGGGSERSASAHAPHTAGTPRDAAPSNTASNSCNETFFKPIRWGVDSLYLSFAGELEPAVERRLKELKLVAQSAQDHEQAYAQFQIDEHVFEVKDKGAGLFPYVLDDNAFRIQLSRRGKKLPMAYVKVSAPYLAHVRPDAVEDDLTRLLSQLGELTDSASVGRIDLYVDFVTSVDMESWTREAWITRAANISSYACGNEFSGWAIGMGGVMACRLYDKTLEIESSKKFYLQPMWTERGWKQGERVWRLEFQFRRELLSQKGVVALYTVLNHLNGLWSYATTEWLRLAMPNPEDRTRSRWPIHPLWIALASIDWESDGGALSKRFSLSRAPSDAGLCRMAFGALISYMAREREFNFWRGWALLGEQVETFYGSKAHLEGVRWEQYVEEKVRIKGRRFNTICNANEIAEEDRKREERDAELEAFVREYRKQSRGG